MALTISAEIASIEYLNPDFIFMSLSSKGLLGHSSMSRDLTDAGSRLPSATVNGFGRQFLNVSWVNGNLFWVG